jgi:hypothetical protein
MREFGLQQFYLPHQISFILEKYTFNRRYEFYAYAILASERDYNSYIRPVKSCHDYFSIRQQIADHYFKGDISFTICDLLAKSIYRVRFAPYMAPLHKEKDSGASIWDCLHKCRENESFNLTKE